MIRARRLRYTQAKVPLCRGGCFHVLGFLDNLDRTTLDPRELAEYQPVVRALSLAFIATALVGLAVMAHWRLLIVPLWVALVPIFLYTLHAGAALALWPNRPRLLYAQLIVTSSAVSLAYVHFIVEPIGSLAAFAQPVFYAQAFFFITPRFALAVLTLSTTGLVVLRAFETAYGLKPDLLAYPLGQAAMAGTLVILAMMFAVLWLVSDFVSKQRIKEKAARDVLDQAYQDLRVLEKSRSELLASVTHELKTPLVTVRGYVDLAIRAVNDARVKDGLVIARRSALRLQRLIEELLMAADPNKTVAQLQFSAVDIHKLLEEEVANFSAQASANGVAIVQIGAKTKDTIWADHERVGQVVSNLLSNALRFAPQDSVIEVGARALNASEMLVWVADQGPGISPAKLAHLFEEHYVRGTSSVNERGTGLGLTISKRLVMAMGGRLAVESSPEAGTTFSLTFPVRSQAAVAAEQPNRPRRALVLDDEADVLSLMEYHLRTAGYETTALQNGTAAYERAMKEDYDLLFLDVNVPGLTGVEVSRRLREAGRPGRILLFSALIRDDAERLLAEARADGFLPKPFDIEQITAVLEGRRGSAAV